MTALNKKLLSIETEWNQAKSKLARDAAYKQLLEENNALQGKFFFLKVSFVKALQK